MPDFIPPSEAAKILGVSKRWAIELLRLGRIPGQKVGQRWIVDRQAVLDYKARRDESDRPAQADD